MTEVDVPALVEIVKEQWKKERDRADLMEKSFSEQCKHTDELNRRLSAERDSVDQLDILNTGLTKKNEELTSTIAYLRREPGIQRARDISDSLERALELSQDRADKAEAELAGRDEIIDELRRQVKSAGEICSLAQDGMRKAEALAERLSATANRDFIKLLAEIEGLKEDKAKLNAKLSAEVARSEELTRTERMLRSDCASHSATIKGLNRYIDSVRKNLIAARNRADKADVELAELRAERGPAFPPDGVTRIEYGLEQSDPLLGVIVLVGTGKSAKAIATHSRVVMSWPNPGLPNDYWAQYTSAWTKVEKVVLDE